MDAKTHGLFHNSRRSRITRPPRFRQQRAYTLFDALVTLTVVSTLASVAVPSFKHLMANSRLTTQVNLLMTDLHLARSEAIKRGQGVVLCKSRDGRRCTGDAAWHEGWMMFVDTNGNHVADADEPVIRVQDALTGVEAYLNASGGGTTQDHYLGYHPDGYSWKDGTFTFCVPGEPKMARAIIVNLTGRPRVSRRASGNRALTCPHSGA